MAASAARPQTRSVCLPCHRGRSVALPLRHLALVLLLSVLVHDAWGQQWKTNLGPCYRDCTLFPEPRLCRFRWTEEIYAVLTGACGNCSAGVVEDCFRDQCVAADGVERTIYTINRQMIGPGIHVCRGDTIRVDLEVKKPGGAETIHWHGLPQRLTPYYDGVAWVTQCPILFGNTFRYEFLAEPAGTYFWHSHSGVNKVNGIEGAMVIRTSDMDNPHRFLYDYDDALHTILLQDWMHVPAEFPLPGLRSRYVQRSDATLVNGQGRFRSTVVNVTTLTPTATFEVLPGFRYRFRIINGGVLSCPIQLQIEDHEMTVIAADGLDIEPVVANTLVTFSGERWDVVVQAKTNPAARAYWILVKTVGPCSGASSNGVARLVYDNSDPTPATPDPGLSGTLYDQGTVVNSLLDNPGDCNNPSKVCAAALSALNHDDDLSPSVQPSRQPVLLFFELRFPVVPDAEIFARNNFEHFLTIGTVSLIAMLNNISYTDPSTPLLTQPGQSESCSAGNLPSRCDGKDRCQCAHVVKVPIGSHVDLVFVDVSAQSGNSSNLISHPMHLHGYSFAVMGEDVLTNFTDGVERSKFVRESYNQGRLASYVRYPALKDVFAVPGGGGYLVPVQSRQPRLLVVPLSLPVSHVCWYGGCDTGW